MRADFKGFGEMRLESAKNIYGLPKYCGNVNVPIKHTLLDQPCRGRMALYTPYHRPKKPKHRPVPPSLYSVSTATERNAALIT